MVTEEEYQRLLNMDAMDKSKFAGVKGALTGQNILEKLADGLFICYEIRYLFTVKPAFQNTLK